MISVKKRKQMKKKARSNRKFKKLAAEKRAAKSKARRSRNQTLSV